MICVAALIVFAILAIFSAKYRPLAKEAFSCVFLKLRLRPCQSGLDRRVRVSVMMPFAKRSPRLGRFVYKAFPVLSTVFVVLTILSFGYMIYGGYNYALYGNCNGPGSAGFCIFDPNGPGVSDTGECTEAQKTPEALSKPLPENLSGFKTIHPGNNFTVIFFGCYSCPYTREAAEPLFTAIAKHPEVTFVLVDFPIVRHAGSMEAANAGNCVYDQNPDAYLDYARQLFTVDLTTGVPDAATIAACTNATHVRTTAGITLGTATGVYGTPTYFIGDKPVVGPLNTRSLEKLIRSEMAKN